MTLKPQRAGKLVRDGIPGLIEARGGTADVTVLQQAEYVQALHHKVLEEAAELRAASPASQLEELADLSEVLTALAAALGFSAEQVQQVAAAKRKERGAFDQRLYLHG